MQLVKEIAIETAMIVPATCSAALTTVLGEMETIVCTCLDCVCPDCIALQCAMGEGEGERSAFYFMIHADVRNPYTYM